MANELKEFDRTIRALEKVYKILPGKAATIAVNFFKERFIAQNWVDTNTRPWKQRKQARRRNRRQRAILTKTGRLRRSIRKITVTEVYALIGTDVPYAQAHNEGFSGTVTVQQHQRTKTKKEKSNYRTRSGDIRSRTRKVKDTGNTSTVKTHTRKMRIPQRKFMGISPVLDTRIERMMNAEFNKVLK